MLFYCLHRHFNRWVSGKFYATFRTPKQICEGGDKVFFLADNSLFSYGKNDKEIRELSRLNILSDNNIILIAKSDNDLLVVVYNNSNIDLIDMNTEKTHNLPYIKKRFHHRLQNRKRHIFLRRRNLSGNRLRHCRIEQRQKGNKNNLHFQRKDIHGRPSRRLSLLHTCRPQIISLSRRRNPLRHKQLGRDAKLLHKKITSFRRRFAYAA